MRYYNLLITLVILLIPNILSAQQTLSDSIIMSAMRDELYRNMKGLHAKDFDDPFFIAYTIANVENAQIIGTLGALVRSDEYKYKDWQIRLMVGDYEINDENFSSSQPEETMFRPSIDMPVEDDYEGIRRSLWLTTNNVYFSAAQTYKNKMAQIEHKQLEETDLEIDDFSHAPVVKKYTENKAPLIDKQVLEDKIKSISQIFADYPDIYSSSVVISALRSTVYFINSEGSEIQFPFNITTLSVQAGTLSDDSERLNKNITYTVSAPDELPSVEEIIKDSRKMAENILTLKKTERYVDDYYGPVMIVGDVAAETLERFLFSGSDALIASRENLQSSNQMNISYEQNDNALQSRINKIILSKDLSIIAEPFLKKYQNIPLLGTFDIDAEGVIPPDSLTLVKDGILQTLLNGRTPTRQVPESNGHMRLSYSFRGLNKQVGPGVVRIVNSNPVDIKTMKQQLLDQAKEEGLDQVMIIRSLDVGGSDKPFNYYLVDVNTGEEKLVRSVKLKNLTMLTLRQSPVFSGSVLVHNTLLSLSGKSTNGLAGVPSSFILPDAILLKNIEMQGTRKPLTSMLPILDNPVRKNANTIYTQPESKE